MPAIGLAADSRAPLILYIYKWRLIGDCICQQLAMHLPGWTIRWVASFRDFQIERSWLGGSLTIFHAHELSLSMREVSDEIAAIAEAGPAVPLIVMSDLEDVGEGHMALRLGARGFLPANTPPAEAAAAIRFVSAGGTYIPQCVLAAASVTQQSAPAGPRDGSGNPIEFSQREAQVLEGLKQGKQNKVIAYELKMNEGTVKVHIRRIMKKLNARNRTQVVLLTSSVNSRFTGPFVV
jgi:DNA-binding NarL/FixJ family response regulator